MSAAPVWVNVATVVAEDVAAITDAPFAMFG